MVRHALVEVGGGERHDNCAHPSQVIDTQITRTAEGACRCSDLPSFDQGLDDWQLAVKSAFFHIEIITYQVNLALRLVMVLLWLMA
jgi:hypothetical protein